MSLILPASAILGPPYAFYRYFLSRLDGIPTTVPKFLRYPPV